MVQLIPTIGFCEWNFVRRSLLGILPLSYGQRTLNSTADSYQRNYLDYKSCKWRNELDPSTYASVEPIVERIAELVDSALRSDELTKLRNALDELSKAIGSRFSANLSVVVDFFDEEREQALPLLNTGFGTTKDGPPYRTWNDSTFQRYLVNGEIHIVPHDHCPKCWAIWDFKFENKSCRHCGLTLGKDCKVLLDSDVCPSCEDGKVSMNKPACDKCGYKVDLTLVARG